MTRCWLSEHHVAITTNGRVLPCTRYKKTEGPNISDDTLKNIWNGPWLNEIRRELQVGNKIDGCRKCWQQETAGVQSMREEYQGQWNSKLQSIEIAFSNHCNYACRHCNSFSSSKWHNDDVLLGRPTPYKKLVEFDLGKLDAIQDITYYKFLGGEPLLNKTHNDFLKKLNNLEQTTLEYTTNGSVYPNSDIIDIWKKCKKVILSVSLDDVHKAFDYFRTGGNFDNVIKNCKKFDQLNIECTFHIVLNVLNLHRMPKILKFVYDNFPNWNIYFDKVNLPQYLRTSQWSKHEANGVIEQISNQRLVNLIKSECTNEHTNLEEFFKVNKILDKSRNTDMFKIYPILKQFQ